MSNPPSDFISYADLGLSGPPPDPDPPPESTPPFPSPIDTKPIDTKPIDTKPIDIKPIETTANELQLARELKTLYEGCRLEAYPDPLSGGDPWTISLGLTFYSDGSKVKRGDILTQSESDREVDAVLQKFFLPPLKTIPGWTEMSAHQKAALISFAWNLGAHFYNSDGFDTISRSLRERNWKAVPDALLLYRNRGSNVELGLGRRRYAEGLVWQGMAPQAAFQLATKITSVSKFA